MTLIEVVAGLALLSTLLVAVLTTRAKLTRQWAVARQQLRAAEAADGLLTVWWQDVKSFPRQASGGVPGEAGLAWRTRVVPNGPVNRLKASVVRLEIIDDSDGLTAGEILAAVEVVLDDERRPRDGEREAGAKGKRFRLPVARVDAQSTGKGEPLSMAPVGFPAFHSSRVRGSRLRAWDGETLASGAGGQR